MIIPLTHLSAQQDIVRVEYYIDNDPGFGNATALTITQGNLIDISNEIIEASSLTPGTHTFGIRALDAAGVWGFTEKRQFYIPPNTTVDPPVADLNALEYYIDDDPGLGNATSIPISVSNEVELPNEIIEASALTPGFHTIGFRARNTDGVWGIAEKREFYIPPDGWVDPPVADITELEYYFDVDPGQGLGTTLNASGPVIDINVIIPQSLSPGYHTLHVRAKNSDGNWGLPESRPIYIKTSGVTDPVYEIVKMEYFLDGEDPGFGSATDLPIVQALEIDLNPVNIPTATDLVDGTHTITFRAQNENGVWGVSETTSFNVEDNCEQPIPGFSPSLACAGEVSEFIDTSQLIDPATVNYRWYVDGQMVSNTAGNLLYTFGAPGDYQVSLAIRQGSICYDSTGMDINIKPKPVATFSAQTVELGDPTIFDVFTFNVDPSAIWEWDFDNDGTVDSNDQSNISFTYADVGTYLVSLRVTDQLGCETFFQKNVTVEPVSSGNTPLVIFTADVVEVGNPTSFTVIYEANIDPAWTWSWDFDTDGTPDDNTTGNTTFTYAQEGSYTATLTVDDGAGNTYDFTADVTVNAVGTGSSPLVVFIADEAVVGNPTSFEVVYQENIDPTWNWSWDFDTDGTPDDNTIGNTAFTYAQAGSYTATLTVDDGAGNTYDFTTDVTVNATGTGTPLIVFTANNVTQGNPTTFTVVYEANIDPMWVWSWDFETDGAVDDNTVGNTQFIYALAGNYTATLSIDDGAGNTYNFTEEVTVRSPTGPPPVVSFSASTVTESEETVYTVEAQENIEPDWVWSWDFESDGVIDDNTRGNTSYTFSSAGEYVTLLTVTDLDGNDYVFSDVAKVLPRGAELEVYNVVTINGDGIYDYLEIENIESTPGNTVKIYDRTGALVFEMFEYNNLQRVFRGLSNINGTRELPQGNYFYTIDRGDGSKLLSGFLYLKR